MVSLDFHIDRRGLLKGLAAGAATSLLPWGLRAQPADERRFLIVITATGGASIIDAMLAIRASESNQAEVLNTFPDALVQSIDGTPFRAIDLNIPAIGPLPYTGTTHQSDFVRRHAQDMMVVTHTGTSVNHLVAQKRALTGNEAWAGRTLQEIVAATYGNGLSIPNVNMGAGGYVEAGNDPTLTRNFQGQVVTDARFFFAGLHGSRGIPQAPPNALIRRARAVREILDSESVFARTFEDSDAIALWKSQRNGMAAIEDQNLITQLNLLSDSETIPLNEYGLASTPDIDQVRAAFPQLNVDPLESQAALAYLLIKNNVSSTVTLGPGLSPLVGLTQIVDSPPLAFDFSHSAHRATQAVMWNRLLSVADRLIGLLKGAEYANGESYWQRSMIYVATDFGRTKNRGANAPEFSSGHDLNNGSLIISPMVNGGQILGGVDPHTALTYGFDPMTGAPDPGRTMTEPEIFAGILQALGIDTSPVGLPNMRAMRRT